jgi:hypothetical protein
LIVNRIGHKFFTWPVHKYEISKAHVRFRNVHLYGIMLNHLYSNDNLKFFPHNNQFNIILKYTRNFGIKFLYLKFSNQNVLPIGRFIMQTICIIHNHVYKNPQNLVAIVKCKTTFCKFFSTRNQNRFCRLFHHTARFNTVVRRDIPL